jgi:hypothetical protein
MNWYQIIQNQRKRQIKDGETILTDAQDLCESFNDYFSTVIYKYLPTTNLDQLNDFAS